MFKKTVMNNLFKISGLLVLVVSVTIYLTSCEKDPTPPSVTTTSVSAITQTTATSGGNVTDDGGAKVTARGVCWSTSPNPTIGSNKTTDGQGTGSFTSNITGLDPDTQYYVRAYATNEQGTSYGDEVSFTTGEILVPTLTTTAVSSITLTSAVSGGNITDNGGGAVTARGICWSTSANPTTADNSTSDGTGTGTFSSNITGLSPSTTYYVRAYATNSVGTAYGNEVTFTTQDLQLPTLTTTAVSSITLTSASSGGNISDDGGASVTARGICWSTSTSPTTANNSTTEGSGTGIFSSNMTGLSPNTTYYVRAYATNSVGTAYGNEVSFTTQAIQVATLTTTAVTSITLTTAVSGGNITSDGGGTVTARGICWSTSTNPTTSDNSTTDGSGTGVFTSNLTGLSPSTTYYVRAYAVNSAGTSYGSQVQFTTQSIQLPTLTTIAPSSVNLTSAVSGGNITSDGGGAVTARGVCWSTSTNPTTSDNTTSNGTGTGVFTSNLTGLSPSTTYYVRAYATNSAGTAYGNQLSFTTTSVLLPTVTTSAVTSITSTTASSGGNVTDDGGGTVTVKGVCWSTSASPTTSDNTTSNGSGLGSFSSNLTSLSPGTTYYVRAYATNDAGTAYGNQVTFTTDAILPTVTTTTVSSITSTSAVSGGNVTYDGGATVTARGVCWSTTTNPTTADNTTSSGTGTGIFTSSMTGLSPGTTYYVRAYATNSEGTAYGSQETFTTNIQLPSLTTTAVGSVTATTAVSGGNITSDGGSDVTARGVCWSTSTNPTTANNTTIDGTGTGSFTSNITGLTPGTTYYVRAYATNGAGTAYGNQVSFSSGAELPTLTTVDVTAITRTTATSGGNITDNGGASITARGVCWSTSASPTTGDNTTDDGTGTGVYSSDLTGLAAGTTYYVRAYATNSAGTAYGNQVQFETDPVVAPTVTTTDASAITQTTATSGGNVTDGGGGTVTARGVCWSTSTNPTTAGAHTTDGTGTGAFSSSLTGLTAGTTYYVRAYATNSAGTTYGNQVQFETDPVELATLTTDGASAVTPTSATSGGNITDAGGGTISARGVCWSTSTNPTYPTDDHTSDGTGTGSFVSSLTGLTPGTTYYVRAYAENSAGTAYGNEVSFTTVDVDVPTVSTTSPSSIGQTSASSGGEVTSDGGADVTARGVCWSTDPTPTIADSHTTDGIGTGIFVSNVTGLATNTTYYVRAYATNSAGTGYGSAISFTTLPLSDPQGNVYETVTIGDQVWMAENLRYLPSIDTAGRNSTTEARYYVYEYHELTPTVAEARATTNYAEYGVLYNYTAALASCPTGWHLPTDAEWKEMEEYIGMPADTADLQGWRGVTFNNGTELKETGSAHWTSGGGTDEHGFAARPGGLYSAYIEWFSLIYDNGYWWTATEETSSLIWKRALDDVNTGISREYETKAMGYAVRCVRD